MSKEATMPLEIVFVRHGQSEANAVQHAEKHGEMPDQLREVYDRHDFMHPLTTRGIQQAKQTGKWLRENDLHPDDFDERYVSPFHRTMQTAAHIGEVGTLWLPELNLIERDWGAFGALPLAQRQQRFADTERRREQSTFYTRYDGGESIPDVIGRVRDFIDTLSREMTDKRVLAVTHGELMWTARYVLERLLPLEWQRMDEDKTLRIGNCAVLQYSRQNPEDPTEVVRSMSSGWRRMYDPNDPGASPYGGEWIRLNGKRRLTGAAMLELVETA